MAWACVHTGDGEQKHKSPGRLKVLLKSSIPVYTVSYFILQKDTLF